MKIKTQNLLIYLIIGVLPIFNSCKKEEITVIVNCESIQKTQTYKHVKTKIIYSPDSSIIIPQQTNDIYFVMKNGLPWRVIYDFPSNIPIDDIDIAYNDSIFYPPFNSKTIIWISHDSTLINIVVKNPGHPSMIDQKRIIFLERI